MKLLRKRSQAILVVAAASALVVGNAQSASAMGGFSPTSPITATPINQNTQQIAPGVVQSDYIFNDRDGQRMESHVLDIDMPKRPELTIEAGLPNDGKGSPWYGMQPMSKQAAAATRPGHQVIAAINADYYNMSDGYPLGVVVKDGTVLKADMAANWFFFGMKKDGSYLMGDRTLFNQVKNDLQQALSGDAQVIKNGARDENQIATKGAPNNLDPRIGIGVRRDGTMFFAEIDGRQTGFSRGLTMSDFADYMLSLGAYNAIHLDSGGSATFATRTPGTDTVQVVNRPSDGEERPVANGFLLVSSAPMAHEFASAAVAPNGMTVTPNSTVQFSAKGQDATGASAPMPTSGLSWSLADPAFGTIDANGLFTSTGRQGQTQAILSHNGKQVGSAWVEVALPDTLAFGQAEISLDYGAVKPLGLTARYQGRDVRLKHGDIAWGGIPVGMGTMDDANVFHAASSGSFDTQVTATLTGGGLQASVHVLLGQLPVVLYDFEDGIGDWKASTAGRGEVSQLQWNTYPDALTRFGEHALQVNFDFTKGQLNATLGAYAGPATSKPIPGRPKAIGAWVHGTPEAQGYWLRCYIYDAKGQFQPINFTTQTEGIDWLGWKYVEAEIPDDMVGPFTTFPNQMFRIMALKSGMPDGNPLRKGSMAIDNVRVTYGASVDDMFPPIVHGINVDGGTFTSSQVEISTSFDEDTTDKHATGINYDRVRMWVDGTEYTNAEGVYALNKGLNTVGLSHLSFADGIHRVDVNVQDNFGNETVKTGYFTVKTGSGTSVGLSSPDAVASLGGTYRLNLTTTDAADVTRVDTKIRIGKDFPVTGVDFAASASGSTWGYDAATGVLTLHVVNSNAAAGPATLAAVKVSVTGDVAPGTKLSWEVTGSTIGYASDRPSKFAPTFSARPASVDVVAALKLAVNSTVVGRPGAVTVTDAAGKPVAGATVTMLLAGKPTKLGTTGADGALTSAQLTDTVKKYDLFAQTEQGRSFAITTQSFPPLKQQAPSNIMAGASADPATTKTITWMSNPLTSRDAAVLQVATKAAYRAGGEAAFTSFDGTAKELTYAGYEDIAQNGVVRSHSATATKLAAGTDYVYRVGDGVSWSGVREFTTTSDATDFTFSVFGDTQSPDRAGLAQFDKILTSIEGQAKLPDFTMHVGDFTDDAGKFAQMDAIAGLLSDHEKIGSADMVRVLGNHEYMGDDGSKAVRIFGQPNNGSKANPDGTYSMDYQNMHVAVIGWTDDAATLKAELDWLKQDMTASDKLWKVVVTHQPPYATNPEDSDLFRALAPVADELGIDLVFSGHDHSYGRTDPLKAGVKTDGGTVYVVTGTTGPKHYSAVNDGSFAVMDDGQFAMYVTVEVAGGKLSLIAKRADESIIEEYSLVKDVDSPVVTVSGVADHGVYNHAVTPVVKVTDAHAGTTTVTLNGRPYDGRPIEADGNYEFKVVAVDKAGNRTESSVAFVVDRTAPVITVNGVTDGQVVRLNQAVPVTWSASDATSGVAESRGDVASDEQLDTRTPGPHTVRFTATDRAGNTATVAITYRVEYVFGELEDPLSDTTAPFKAGRVIPVKFVLTDAAGKPVLDAAPRVFVASVTDGQVGTETPATSASGKDANLMRLAETSGLYAYNWSTKGLAAGDYRVRIDLGDGAVHTVTVRLQ
ncbi:phosphodiester glycosidase family protein [Micromonospora sp. NPDC093277]|uniref:phosphodiester glycosidase family protein n=1 Tax=Micromonospora sp. NPDC093277 TaxID=3364291 RepID=UPI003822E3E1